jgi:pimeloyl-ACP methyl ester carboxylesterase
VPIAQANGIEICFDTFGRKRDPAVLLIMGYMAQMTAWDERFCRILAEGGRWVIRFDNRDCGLSTKLHGVKAPTGRVLAAAAGIGKMPKVPYTLSTMADDAFGLLDHLGVEEAHVVGASMGGMIAQTMAIERPDRVRSLTSIMSTTGERAYADAEPDAMKALMAVLPSDREAYLTLAVERRRAIGNRRWFDPVHERRRAAAAFDRSFYPEGATRQLAAIQASGSRADGLRHLEVPTLVIHGRSDPLVKVSGGLRTAELVPGSALLVLADMAHDLPEPLWPAITEAILGHQRRADAGHP